MREHGSDQAPAHAINSASNPANGDNGAIRIGTAGWSIPRTLAARFPQRDPTLARYACVLNSVEINSTFYRSHRATTFARWAASVPETFRFSVKAPREITHVRRLAGCEAAVAKFVDEARCLGDRLGPILIQLPPGLPFEHATADAFFALLRERYTGPAACEPRHGSWFAPEADAMLRLFRIGRVAADPAPAPGAASPGGFGGLLYMRLHGSPRMYYSAYSDDQLRAVAATLAASAAPERWCVFDNTASGAALVDALALQNRI